MVPTNSRERLRSCCTAGATSTVGGGIGGGGFLQPTATPSARTPATTDNVTPDRAMIPPRVRRSGRLELSASRGVCRVRPGGAPRPISAGGLRPGLRCGRRLRRRHVHHRWRVVRRGERDLDSPVLTPSVRRVV